MNDDRDLTIQWLAAETADLAQRLADARADVEAYRLLAHMTLHQLAAMTATVERQRTRIASLCDRDRLERAVVSAMELAA